MMSSLEKWTLDTPPEHDSFWINSPCMRLRNYSLCSTRLPNLKYLAFPIPRWLVTYLDGKPARRRSPISVLTDR